MSTRNQIAIPSLLLLAAALALQGCALMRGGERSGSDREVATSGLPASAEERKLAEGYFLQGSILQMQERWADAIGQFESVLRLAPEHAPVHYALARCYHALGRNDTALSYAERALAITPDNVDARMQLAELLLANGRLARAVEQYEEIVRREPGNAQARYNAARLLQRIDPPRAIRHYEYIRKYLAEDYGALLNLAELYMNQRDFNAVVDVIRELLMIDPGNPDLYRLLDDAYQHAGRYEEATALLGEVEAHIAPDSVLEEFMIEEGSRTARNLYGVSMPAMERYGGVVASKLLDRYPKRWESSFYSAMIYYHLGDSLAADSLFHRALQNKNAPATAWSDAAALYLEDDRIARALRFLAPAAPRFKDDYHVLATLGYAYDDIGRADSAERYIKRSLAIEEQNGEAWGRLGEIYAEQGKSAAAENAFERSVEYDADDHEMLNNYAYFLAGRGRRLEYALALVDRALDAEPENEAFLDTKGWIYFKLADYKRALQYIQHSVDIGGAGADVLEHLGDTQIKLGNIPAAREAYARALKLDPENRELKRKLEEVGR